MDTRPTPAASEAQRRAWRRERLRDAARLLPVFGLALFVLPDLVLSGSDASGGATQPWLVYLFLSWGVLIAIAIYLARLHRADGERPPE
ncbi:MAG: hypothetical protein WBA67_13585 [Jannaschia sp.]